MTMLLAAGACPQLGIAARESSSFELVRAYGASVDARLRSTGVPRRSLRASIVRAAADVAPKVSSPIVGGENAGGIAKHYECVIVGAGISGLCTAQALVTRHSLGDDFLVTESRERVGGNITTVEGNGYLWEEGPNSFQPNDSMLSMAAAFRVPISTGNNGMSAFPLHKTSFSGGVRLTVPPFQSTSQVDSDLKEELVLGDPDAPRFVYWNGKLRPVPAGPGDLPFFDLLSIFGKLRAGFGALGLKPPPPDREESVEEFVRRNLGDEVFERLIEPFCSGVYAGDPAKLSMKAAFGKVWKLEHLDGSIVKGAIRVIQDKKKNPPPPRDPRLPTPKGQTVGSFRKGLQTLPNAIAKKLGDKVKTSWKLTSIEQSAAGDYILSYETPEGKEIVSTKVVVLTVPSYVASDLLATLSKRTAEALARFYYPPVAAVTISYPKSAIKEEHIVDGELKGFGQLHPRSQGIQTLGTIYSSALFPGRAPEDRVLLLNYIGGATYTQITTMDEEAIVGIVDKDVRKMLVKADAPEPVVHGVRVWPRAIPQFTIGHLDTLEDARNGLKEAGLEGIFLGGNYVAGVALGRCVEFAYESAEQVSSYIKQNTVL